MDGLRRIDRAEARVRVATLKLLQLLQEEFFLAVTLNRPFTMGFEGEEYGAVSGLSLKLEPTGGLGVDVRLSLPDGSTLTQRFFPSDLVGSEQ